MEKKLKLIEKFRKNVGKIGEKKVEKKVQKKFYVGTKKVICRYKKVPPRESLKKV